MDGRKISPFYRTSSPYQGRCPKIVHARSHAVNFCMRVHFCVHVYFRICVSVRRLTFLLFQSLKIDRSFLAKDPSAWAEEVRYQGLSNFVKNLKVVNDVAEHAIQIVTNYAGKITKDEHQLQYLLATIAQQRRERNDLRRKSLQPASVIKGAQPSSDRLEFLQISKL